MDSTSVTDKQEVENLTNSMTIKNISFLKRLSINLKHSLPKN